MPKADPGPERNREGFRWEKKHLPQRKEGFKVSVIADMILDQRNAKQMWISQTLSSVSQEKILTNYFMKVGAKLILLTAMSPSCGH